jgi:hypothetical protein
MGQVRVLPMMGTVYTGTGTVWKNPTRGLPILNPRAYSESAVYMCSNDSMVQPTKMSPVRHAMSVGHLWVFMIQLVGILTDFTPIVLSLHIT